MRFERGAIITFQHVEERVKDYLLAALPALTQRFGDSRVTEGWIANGVDFCIDTSCGAYVRMFRQMAP
jgi:hypothetical protein